MEQWLLADVAKDKGPRMPAGTSTAAATTPSAALKEASDLVEAQRAALRQKISELDVLIAAVEPLAHGDQDLARVLQLRLSE